MHIYFLLEEPSAEAMLVNLVPRIIGADVSFSTHVFGGLSEMQSKLEARLRGYVAWLPDDHRIVILRDRDAEDCMSIKRELEEMCMRVGLTTRRNPAASGDYQVVTRLAIEELEAWFFGDVEAMCTAFPRVPPTLASRARYRDSDAITGGTWEALERVLQSVGYYKTGLRKIDVAGRISEHMVPARNRSVSFGHFVEALS